jgi:hypothetical protein
MGEKLAVDSKAIRSWGRPVADEDKRQQDDRRRDVEADWGTKTYKGQRADGTKWEKVSHWFGFKLHLLVDAVYELPLAFEVDQASSSDATHLMPLVEQLAHKHPELAASAEELSADKAYARRASVERVNSRLDCVLGFEQHTIRGLKKMRTRVTLALIVMLAMALGRIEADQAELMRSMTAPARKAA